MRHRIGVLRNGQCQDGGWRGMSARMLVGPLAISVAQFDIVPDSERYAFDSFYVVVLKTGTRYHAIQLCSEQSPESLDLVDLAWVGRGVANAICVGLTGRVSIVETSAR